MKKSIVIIMVLMMIATIWSHGGFDNMYMSLEFWKGSDIYCDVYNLYADVYNFFIDIAERGL